MPLDEVALDDSKPPGSDVCVCFRDMSKLEADDAPKEVRVGAGKDCTEDGISDFGIGLKYPLV